MHCPPCGYEKVTASRGLNLVNSGALFSAHGYIYCKRLYFYQYSWSHFQNILNCRCSCMIQRCCYSKRCHDIYDYFPHIRQHLGEVGRKPSVTIKAYFILTYIHYHQCTIYIAGTNQQLTIQFKCFQSFQPEHDNLQFLFWFTQATRKAAKVWHKRKSFQSTP